MGASNLYLLLQSELADMPPWKFVTTKQLTSILDIHPQTAANWRHRSVGPPPAPAEWFKGRPTRYRISHVFAWAHEDAGIPKQPWEINGEWLRDNMQFEDWANRDAVQRRVTLLMKHDARYRPADLRRAGRVALGVG